VAGVRLGVEGREDIGLAIARDESLAEVARRLGRPTSTVAREVARSGGRVVYAGRRAQRGADERARRPKIRKLVADAALAAVWPPGWGRGEAAGEPSRRRGDAGERRDHLLREELPRMPTAPHTNASPALGS